MKRIFYVKMAMLFLLALFVFSFVIIDMKNIYVKNREKEVVEKVASMLEKIKIEESEITKEDIKVNEEIGIILIPALNVEAPIFQGVTSEVLKYSVGHFEETSLWNGNVVLASHNRGSYAHYFWGINELKNGEEIIYITNMGERRYKVVDSKIIEETNVDILGDTEENTLTLITCVTGEKSKRRCVIGKEYN